ncbi:Zn(2)-C6 fungal-type domain-containing protein [Fusarium falciforme]|uniref:Zn(2)-C6 fungal-type domain-containing protein n=1 Tax=Fusarium falciforme TaxID=195108 RepID=UPI002300D139|nr:Zn(2)-C6 fungal-type domain-containing protein [Fusarium falciforme]WAO91601.1 Zn(2)-C6 fungal-type domain-containing protein [Fusarium falciforme]
MPEEERHPTECFRVYPSSVQYPQLQDPEASPQRDDNAKGKGQPASDPVPTPCSSSSNKAGDFEVRPTISAQLPPFISPLPVRIPADDVAFLYSKGAFTLPSVDCQNALLRSYFNFTYPHMPSLDMNQFLGAMTARDAKPGQVSLLLLQAILFAGAAHVSMDHLKAAGFHTRKHARRKLFQRARLLYDFDYESDRLVLVQALLLMSLWNDGADDHRGVRYWTDLAISQAFALGLHQDSSQSVFSPVTRKLCRRIWWVCFIKDRLTSLEMKQMPRLRDGDYEVSMLEDADFDIGPVPASANIPFETMCSYFWDEKRRRDLGALFTAKVTICQCWGAYLTIHVSLHAEQRGNSTLGGFKALETATKAPSKHSFTFLRRELEMWHKSLPECCHLRWIRGNDLSTDAAITISRTALHMLYQFLVLAMERIYVMSTHPRSLLDKENARIWVQEAALQISDLAGEAHGAGIDSLLPISATTAITAAAGVHLQVLKGDILADKQMARDGFRRCMEVIKTLADGYEPTNHARSVMEWAVLKPIDHTVQPQPGRHELKPYSLPGEGILWSLERMEEEDCQVEEADSESRQGVLSIGSSPPTSSLSKASTKADFKSGTAFEAVSKMPHDLVDITSLPQGFGCSLDELNTLFDTKGGESGF